MIWRHVPKYILLLCGKCHFNVLSFFKKWFLSSLYRNACCACSLWCSERCVFVLFLSWGSSILPLPDFQQALKVNFHFQVSSYLLISHKDLLLFRRRRIGFLFRLVGMYGIFCFLWFFSTSLSEERACIYKQMCGNSFYISQNGPEFSVNTQWWTSVLITFLMKKLWYKILLIYPIAPERENMMSSVFFWILLNTCGLFCLE